MKSFAIPFDNFIFDIGNVVLEYDDSKPLLRHILSTDLWKNFELGGDNTSSIYAKLSSVLGVESEQIADIIKHVQENVRVNTSMVEFIRSLRNAGKTVVALTNMPQPFYSYFQEHHDFWDCFTDIYVSSEIGLRKPNPKAFQHVIYSSQLLLSQTLVVDDSAENIASARSLGLKAVLFEQTTDILATLKVFSNCEQSVILPSKQPAVEAMAESHNDRLCSNSGSQIQKPLDATSQVLFRSANQSWLKSAVTFIRKSWDVEEGLITYASHHFHLDSEVRAIPADVFCTLLVYDVLPSGILGPILSRSIEDFLCRNHHESGLNYFFVDRSLTSSSGIGAEVDTAAMYLTVLLEHGLVEGASLADATTKIVSNTDSFGVIQVFFPPRGEREGRVDTVVCANVLAFLYKYGYAEILKETEDYLYNELRSGRYLGGSQNYINASTILFSIVRATVRFGPKRVQVRFRGLLEESIEQVLDQAVVGDLDLAMRIIVAKQLGVAQSSITDLETLLRSHQQEDGAWPKQSIYRTVRSRLYFGAESLTTAFAIRALTS